MTVNNTMSNADKLIKMLTDPAYEPVDQHLCASRIRANAYNTEKDDTPTNEAVDSWSQFFSNHDKMREFRSKLNDHANIRLDRLKRGLASLCRDADDKNSSAHDDLSVFSDDSRDYAEYDPEQEVMVAMERGEVTKDVSLNDMLDALSDSSDEMTVVTAECYTVETHDEFYTDPSELNQCALVASHEDTDTQIDEADDTSSNSSIDQEELLRMPSGTVTGERTATLKYIETLEHEEFRYFREEVLEQKHRRIGTQEALDLDRNERWLEAAQLRASLSHDRFVQRNTEMRTAHVLPGTFFVNVNDSSQYYLICDGITLFRYTVYGFESADARNWFMRTHPIRNGSVFPYNAFDSDEDPIHVNYEAVQVEFIEYLVRNDLNGWTVSRPHFRGSPRESNCLRFSLSRLSHYLSPLLC
jgi:hypothetical protein